MKKSRKTIALIITLMMALTLLAACGGGAQQSGGDNSTAQQSGGSDTPQQSGGSTPQQSGGSTYQAASPEDLAVAAPEGEDVNFVDSLIVLMDSSSVSVIDLFSPIVVGSSTNWVFNMVFDSLLKRDLDGTIQPHLAKTWDTQDGKTYHFT